MYIIVIVLYCIIGYILLTVPCLLACVFISQRINKLLFHYHSGELRGEPYKYRSYEGSRIGYNPYEGSHVTVGYLHHYDKETLGVLAVISPLLLVWHIFILTINLVIFIAVLASRGLRWAAIGLGYVAERVCSCSLENKKKACKDVSKMVDSIT